MRAIGAVPCALLAACIPGDLGIFLPVQTDAYQLPNNRVPRELIEERDLVTRDGVRIVALAAWQPSAATRPTVLYLHGQGGNLDDCWGSVSLLWERGYNVYAVDYRGFGKSEGTPSERGLYDDALAAYDDLASGGADPERLLVWGYSLGTGVASWLVLHARVSALVLEAPFTSMRAMIELSGPYSLPAEWFTDARFDTLRRIDEASLPLVVVHGTADRRIPLWMGEKVYARANEPKRFVEVDGAGHSEALALGHEAIRAALEQVASAVVPP